VNTKKLNKLLVTSRCTVYRIAVNLYCYIKSSSRAQNNINELRFTRAKLGKTLGCSKRSISDNLAVLERFGLIERIIKDTISDEGKTERNTLFIKFLNEKEGLNNA